MAWRAQGHRFLTCVGVIFSVKRASRTSKKWGFGFEIHRLHLQLRLGVMTSKTTASDPEAFPKRLAPEQGNSMAWRAQGHRFSTSVGVIFGVKRASRTSKKWGFGFEIHRLHLQLRLGVMTSKTTASDPEAFPKRLAPEQGNSMAWRAQGHRFSTSVGVIFGVKRCVFVRCCLLWLTASGRAPPGRQGSADFYQDPVGPLL